MIGLKGLILTTVNRKVGRECENNDRRERATASLVKRWSEAVGLRGVEARGSDTLGTRWPPVSSEEETWSILAHSYP